MVKPGFRSDRAREILTTSRLERDAKSAARTFKVGTTTSCAHNLTPVVMADTVLQHVTSQNRPFNATNVADALGKHGIKKGLAQKYLEQLAEQGKINVKDGGKQKVFFALQTDDVMSGDESKAMEAEIKEKSRDLVEAKSQLQQKHVTLRQLSKTLTIAQMKLKTESLAKQNGALELKLEPLRASKGDEISPATLKKTEDNFVSYVTEWQSRRRKFTDAFETILDSTGATKNKMADDIGLEFDPEDVAARLPELKKTVDDIKKKRAQEAQAKKFKSNHVR
tara:strand:+ start:6965 stop:7804 length:840 start_codon:yes stop_codon:yes gene_type:complete